MITNSTVATRTARATGTTTTTAPPTETGPSSDRYASWAPCRPRRMFRRGLCVSDTVELGESLTWPAVLLQRGFNVMRLEISDRHDHNSQDHAKNDNRKKYESDIQHRYRAGRQHK